jgi:hypothetical protein
LGDFSDNFGVVDTLEDFGTTFGNFAMGDSSNTFADSFTGLAAALDDAAPIFLLTRPTIDFVDADLEILFGDFCVSIFSTTGAAN